MYHVAAFTPTSADKKTTFNVFLNLSNLACALNNVPTNFYIQFENIYI